MPNRDATDHQVSSATEVRLHQRTHGVAPRFFGQHAAGRADAALPAKATGASASANCPLRHRPRGCGLNRRPHVLGADVTPLQVVEVTVVGFAHDHVGGAGADAHLWTMTHRVLHQRIRHEADVEGVGQRNRCLNDPQLAHLFKATHLAEPVDGVHGRAHLLAEQIVAVGQNHRHTGAHGPLSRT